MQVEIRNHLGQPTGTIIHVDPAKIDLFAAALDVFNDSQYTNIQLNVQNLADRLGSDYWLARSLGFAGSYGQFINAVMFAFHQCFDGELDGDDLAMFHIIKTEQQLRDFLANRVIETLDSEYTVQEMKQCLA